MKKVVNFVKEYSIFLLFLIPVMLIIYFNKSPNNDIWFILSCGRYVFANGIPTIEPFTIHEGFSYIMQQWLSASIFWGLFNTFGKYGILTLMYVISFASLFIFYKLCRVVGSNRNVSVVLSVFAFSCSFNYMMTRPQIFTYMILLLEILLMELYVKKGNVKVLYLMPFLSVFLINLHITMWYFQFVFMLPFIVNAFYIKKVSIDKYKLKPLLIVALFMFLVGFINPYGFDAISFIFKSYGVSSINMFVGEMKSPIFSYFQFKVTLLCIFFVIFMLFFNRKKRFDVRHILFICGTFVLYMMHDKCFPYFCFVYFYTLAYYFRGFNFDIKKIKYFENKYVSGIFNSLKYSILLFILATFVFFAKLSYEYYNFYPALSFDRDSEYIADFLEDNYNLEDIRLLTDYNNGGYYIYRGIKVYIDPRAEVFLKANNGKEDIFDEFLKIQKVDFDYKKFLDKYNFTHLIAGVDTNLDKYLRSDSNYELVYVLYFQGDKNQPFENVYVDKRISQEVIK